MEHLDDNVGGDRAGRSCRGYLSQFLVLYRLFRGLSSGVVILALQAAHGSHLGVDDLGVAHHVGRLLDGNVGSRPAGLLKDGVLHFAYWQDASA